MKYPGMIIFVLHQISRQLMPDRMILFVQAVLQYFMLKAVTEFLNGMDSDRMDHILLIKVLK